MWMAGFLSECCLHPGIPGGLLVPVVIIVVIVYSGCGERVGKPTSMAGLASVGREAVQVMLEYMLRTA